MAKKKPKKRFSESPDGKFLDQVGKYLGRHGWTVLVAGPSRVQQQPGASKFNFELVVGFTGKKREE